MNNSQPTHSRRDFITQTLAATGAGVLLAGTVAKASGSYTSVFSSSGRVRIPRASEPIRIGVIGTGGMGTGHCESITTLAKQGHENVQIVAVCDVCDPRAEQAKSKITSIQGSSPDSYRKHEDLLARDDIHGVLIASPEHWHSQHAIDAIVAGKDVYCEKPMTLNLDMALALYKAVNDHPDRMFQVGTQMMQLPKYQEAQKLVGSGAIGVPTFSQTSYCRNSKDGEWLYYGIDKNWKPGENLDWERWCKPLGREDWSPEVYARWRRYRRWSTGIVGDLLVHQMTPLMMALGQGWPTRVVASGSHLIDKKMENHDQVNLTIEFETGHIMTVAGSTCNEVGMENLIRGHKANIYLGGRHCEMRPERLYVDEIEEQRIDCPDIGNDQDKHRLGWLSSIRTRVPPLAGVELGTQVMVAVDLATKSMWDGHAYRFDPKTMRASRA